MTQQATDRIVQAVDLLAVQPGDHILEIGCGHGVAVSLVCEKLVNGTITAIDRSPKMIALAEKRNQLCMAAGKAVFRCLTLEAADFGEMRFDKIFAIRVNFFIQQPGVQLPILRNLLKPQGALYLFYDSPAAGQATRFVAGATASLHAHGFKINQVHEVEWGVYLVVGIT